jgi:hypothetical protein
MGYFEQNPLALIAAIIVTIEGWAALKAFLKKTLLDKRVRGERVL